MDPLKIIEEYYDKNEKAYRILVDHSKAVSKKAIEIAESLREYNFNKDFILEAAMLHDIGVFLTDAPAIGCYGEKPYLLHGVLGREILEKRGYYKHAQLCENHLIISAEEIKEKNLSLPAREMVPITVEEEIISLADKFFSKSSEDLFQEKSVKEVKEEMERFGDFKVERMNYLIDKYKVN